MLGRKKKLLKKLLRKHDDDLKENLEKKAVLENVYTWMISVNGKDHM